MSATVVAYRIGAVLFLLIGLLLVLFQPFIGAVIMLFGAYLSIRGSAEAHNDKMEKYAADEAAARGIPSPPNPGGNRPKLKVIK